MKKKNYFEEIQRLLKGAEKNISSINTLCSLCQQYYWKYLIRENVKQAEKVLQCYFDEENLIAIRKKKKESSERFELEEKLYLEFLWEIRDKYYCNKKMEEIVHDINWKNLINDCFIECPSEYLTNISTIFKKAKGKLENYILERHDYTNMHKAMESVRYGISIPAPSVRDSVEKVIAEERLEIIIAYLERKDNIGSVGALLTVAPITKALYSGSYRKYLSGKTIFFNIKSDYNLKELEKRVNDIKDLLERYEDTIDELKKYRKLFK